jgi:hypothetical protein
MSLKSFFPRLLAGLVILGLTLTLAFGLCLLAIPTWGATGEEADLVLPGDELSSDPLIKWTNATTIDAPPSAVWPWIAQIGDTRGGFYSYTTIENRVGAITGATDYNVIYVNANEIVPEWQNPAPGDQIVQDSLQLRDVQPGQYMLADNLFQAGPFGWTWLWQLYPQDNGERTRLLVRMAIDLPDGEDNPIMTFFMTVGGFVMNQKMLDGIRLRAEGGREGALFEKTEVTLWLVSLAVGFSAAGLYLYGHQWRRSLLVAVGAVLLFVILLVVQPPMLIRLLLTTGLLAGLWWAYRQPRASAQEAAPAVLAQG